MAKFRSPSLLHFNLAMWEGSREELYNSEPTPAQLPANEKEKEVDNAYAAKAWNYSVKKAKDH